jgi:hypothetical protein
MSKKSIAVLAIVVVFIAIQFVPVDRSNPPVQGEIDAPPAVSDVLRRSCYNCHSNETRWPWYSRVAPVSWFLSHHVHEGREKLNFSTWAALIESDRTEIVREIWDEVSEGDMPLRSYLIMHPEAKLSEQALESIRAWSLSSRGNDTSD